MIALVRVLLLLTAFTTSLAFAQAPTGRKDTIGGLSLSPLIYRIAHKKGDSGTLEFLVGKAEGQPVGVRLTVRPVQYSDWTYAPIFDRPHARDASRWFPSKRIETIVQPGQGPSFKFTYKVPGTANGPYWACMTFEPRPLGSTDAAQLRYEVPILIQVGPGKAPTVRVGNGTMMGTPTAPRLRLPMVNDSSAFAVVGASVQIRGALTNSIVAEGYISDRNVLPSTKRELIVTIPALRPGRYRAAVFPIIGFRKMPPIVSPFYVDQKAVTSNADERLLEQTPVVVDPMGLDIQTLPGNTKIQNVRIQNQGSKPISLALSLRSVEQSPQGFLGVGLGKAPDSLQVMIEPNRLDLQPRASRNIKLRIQSSKASRGDQWFGLLIEEPDNEDAVPQQVLAAISLKGTLQPSMKLEPGGFQINNEGNPQLYQFKIRNTGNAGVRPIPQAGVADASGRLVNTLTVEPLGDGGIIPGAVLKNSVMLPPYLPPGRYALFIRYTYGQNQAANLRVPFEYGKPKAPTPKKAATPAKTRKAKG